MACLQMYNQNNDRKPLGPPMSPRLSFSNDFVESNNLKRTYRDAPVSSDDFEFSVTNNYSMINSTADELFSQGRLLPLKENTSRSSNQKMMTLKDELEVVDEVEGFSLKPPKSSTRWKGFLGLKKSHIGSRKVDKNGGSSSTSHHMSGNTSQEMMNDGSTSSCSKNVEFRM